MTAQRGFPIRKSSDQSSIISSPRLIADLYVLLRLQMPRHPPSALRNLISHEYESIADKIRRSHQGLTNDLAVASNDQVFVCDIRIKRSFYLRCSRPLCSSQNTGGTHCAWTNPVTQESEDRGSFRACGPEVRSALRQVRSLRTQQRAKDQLLHRHLFQSLAK